MPSAWKIGYEDKILMLGDAVGDMEAADSIGALYYPIMPKSENDCWIAFEKEGLKKFIDCNFKGEYEDGLRKKFDICLPEYLPEK